MYPRDGVMSEKKFCNNVKYNDAYTSGGVEKVTKARNAFSCKMDCGALIANGRRKPEASLGAFAGRFSSMLFSFPPTMCIRQFCIREFTLGVPLCFPSLSSLSFSVCIVCNSEIGKHASVFVLAPTVGPTRKGAVAKSVSGGERQTSAEPIENARV